MQKLSMRKQAFLLAIVLFICGLVPALVVSLENIESKCPIVGRRDTLRLVCTSPALCEIVYALGLGDKVVGLGDECRYPLETARVRKIGNWTKTSAEVLVMVRPNMLLTQGMNNALESFSRNHDLQVLDLSIQDLAGLFVAIKKISVECGVQSKGRRLVEQIAGQLDEVREKSTGLQRESVLLTIARTEGTLAGILTAGKRTFLSQLLEIAGGKNVFADAVGLWPQISRETLLMRSPEIIIELIPQKYNKELVASLRRDWEEMSELRAVRNGQVYYICSEGILIPGVRIGNTAEEFYRILHKCKRNK